MNKKNYSANVITFINLTSLIAILIGISVLLGLLLNLYVLTKGAKGYTAVAPNTAICLILSGLSLYFITKKDNHKAILLSKIITLIVFFVGLFTLVTLISGVNISSDTWLIPGLFNDADDPKRMAGVTALNFILLSLALYFNKGNKSNNFFLLLIVVPLIDSIIAIAGYVYDVKALYSLGSFYKLSIYTAVAFLFLSGGILFLFEDTKIVKLIKSDDIGGILVRRFIPFLVLLIIMMRVISELGCSLGYYTSEFGDALEIVGNIIIITSFIIRSAYTIQKFDIELESSRKQNRLLASIVQSTTDAVISKSLDGIITSWNDGSEKLFGYKAEEIVGKPITLLLPEDKIKEYNTIMESVVNGKYVSFHETTRMKKNGDLVDVSVNVSPIKDSEGKVTGASSIERDITEQKIAQERLNNYTERLQILNRLMRIISSSLEIENIFNSFITELGQRIQFDRSGIVLLNNEKDKWIIDRMWSTYKPIIAEKQWRNVKGSVIGEVLREGVPFVENRLGERGEFNESSELQKEGIKSRAIFPLKIQDQIIGFFTQGSTKQNAFNRDDIELLTSLSDFLSIAVQNSNLYEKIKQMNEELEQRVQDRTLELNELNKELEGFAYSVSHDLKAPLRAIEGFAKVLIEDNKDNLDKDAIRVLNIIIQNSQKMSILINDLLTFSRASRHEINQIKLNINEIIYSALAQLCTYTDNNNVDIDIQDNIPSAIGDKSMIQLVIMNLLSNAFKFSSSKRKPKIKIGFSENGDEIVYYVKDNGVGFNMKYYDKLFGVFQRLHSDDEFEGTGVGLALVQKIIQKHGGKVWAESEINKGAAFYFSLKKEGKNK